MDIIDKFEGQFSIKGQKNRLITVKRAFKLDRSLPYT